MRIAVRTREVKLWLPIPVNMAGFIMRMLPESLYIKLRQDIPRPYDELVNKAVVGVLLGECMDIIRENKGLEIVHVEAADGTFVSIRL